MIIFYGTSYDNRGDILCAAGAGGTGGITGNSGCAGSLFKMKIGTE